MFVESLTAFAIGLLIGSFLNVCIYRIPLKESVFWSRSYCPHCRHTIPFYHNIPLLSYLILRGKCANCKKKISPVYPVVEFLSAAATVLIYNQFGVSGAAFFYILFIYSLIVITFIDFQTKLIPNTVLLFLLGSGVLINLIFYVIPWSEALLGFIISGSIMYALAVLGKLLFKKESMGMGDVKFSAVAGFFLGWKLTIAALYFGFVFALFFAVFGKLISKSAMERVIPMGPFFSVSFFLFLLWGNHFFKAYVSFING